MNLDDVIWDDICPKCGRKVEKSLAWIKAQPRLEVACECGFIFDIDASKLAEGLSDLGEEPID